MIAPVKEKIILGIDPGTNLMGYGVLRVLSLIHISEPTRPY